MSVTVLWNWHPASSSHSFSVSWQHWHPGFHSTFIHSFLDEVTMTPLWIQSIMEQLHPKQMTAMTLRISLNIHSLFLRWGHHDSIVDSVHHGTVTSKAFIFCSTHFCVCWMTVQQTLLHSLRLWAHTLFHSLWSCCCTLFHSLMNCSNSVTYACSFYSLLNNSCTHSFTLQVHALLNNSKQQPFHTPEVSLHWIFSLHFCWYSQSWCPHFHSPSWLL